MNEFADNQDVLDLSDFFSKIYKNFYLIAGLSLCFAFIAFGLSFSFDKRYESNAILKVTNSSQTMNPISSNSSLGAIAAISGFSGSGADKGEYVMAVIKSRRFLETLLDNEGVLENLMAVESFDEESKSIEYNGFYDDETKQWSRPKKTLLLSLLGKNFITDKPTLLEAHEKYKNIVSIYQDRQDKFIRISVTHMSPIFANDLLTLIVSNLNSIESKKDFLESREALDYLYEELDSSILIRDATSKLIESQLQKQMLTQISDDYLLQYIDRSYIPERKSSPSRLLFLIMGFFLGLFASFIYVFFYKEKKD